jgi:DNA modification methylase
MTKTKASAAQRSLTASAERANTQEAMYAGDQPNPSLREFVEQNRTDASPLTPKTLPVSQRVKKAGHLYDVHSYWSKKPYLAIEPFIEHYTQPGALVLDPFVGCGSTLQAALGTGRNAIGIDLSPSATHIAANTTSHLSPHSFQKAAEQLFSAVSQALAAFYSVEFKGHEYVVSSFIHAEQVRCIKCLRLFSIIEPHTSDARRACPHCKEPFSTRSRNVQFGPDEIVACELRESLSARRGQLHWLCDSDSLRAKLSIKCAQEKVDNLRKELDLPVPQRLLDLGGRLNTSGSTTLGRLFDDHSLVALSAIREAIHDVPDALTRGKLLLAFSAILKNCSKMYRFHEGGGGSPIGAYYVPPIRKELNPLFAFQEKLEAVSLSLQEISRWGSQSFVVSNQSATELDVPSNSVDYVFTDPPYADTMPFGDLNFLWDGWLFPESLCRTGEAIGESWYPVMLSVFNEVRRVLKPGACCSVCYHDTSEGTWADLLDLMAEAGFKAIIGKDVLYIETTQRAYQQTVADKVVKRDHVVNFVKSVRAMVALDLVNLPTERSVREIASKVIIDFLSQNAGVSKDRVYDEVVARMFQTGRMDTSIFEEVLREVAEEVKEPSSPRRKGQGLRGDGSSRWYLKSTADSLTDSSEVKREDTAAAHLAKFIGGYLKEKPELEGVHYSDLFEQYLPVHDKPRRLLNDWLPEYFIKTAGGTWRLPDEEESQQLAQLREAGTLRRIKRFANALIEGVPVRDKDRPGNDVDLLDWLRQCRRAGLYEQGKAIFEKGGLNSANLTDEQQIEAEDDYRICARRGSTEEAKPKRQRRVNREDDE